ncbi:MAG: hypothetical protein EPN23_09500 [Verrucomicrobia bacterium]|nr:MAG: hypothetical protein EPN23_09500 [Verrucomicrobiota bacterium]
MRTNNAQYKLLLYLVFFPGMILPLAKAADAAHLVIANGPGGKAEQPTLSPASQQNTVVFEQPGRYGGWPANQGIWAWGDEIVVGFTAAWFKHSTTTHAVDFKKSFENGRPVVAMVA